MKDFGLVFHAYVPRPLSFGCHLHLGAGDGNEAVLWVGCILWVALGIRVNLGSRGKLSRRLFDFLMRQEHDPDGSGNWGRRWGFEISTEVVEVSWGDYFLNGKQRVYVLWRDWLLGKHEYTPSVTEPKRIRDYVELPEGRYEGEVVLTRPRWKRPRWPFAKEIDRLKFTPDKPIPVPGRGTTECNVGEDAILSVTMPIKGSVRKTLDGFAEDTVRFREKFGGPNWEPKGGSDV